MNYGIPTKTARMQAVVAKIDAGSSFGRIEIGTPLMGTVLAAIALAKPCGTVAGGVLTFSGFPRGDTAADANGTAAAARIVDSDGNVIVDGLSVSDMSGAGELKLSSLAIVLGMPVTVDSAAITHAA